MAEVKNEPRCQCCGSKNVYGMTRVVGYFSKIDDWNKSKKAELKDRQKGTYNVPAKGAEV
ncbi:Anaerobic ribonucleoside-triphosphate reductase [Candidatus Tiddalikarchaeum anstoanum]|nr:Anaerobic ribonucleoside-triphosphate reductase [Candidatus Tiddalikarchaeum anstoanum]